VKTIGLTGGIGSGKSTAARILGELGAQIIDADRVGHSVYDRGTPGWEQVVAVFGRDIVAGDGTIDRQRLGAIVFADSTQLARLNAIVHPLIAAAVRARIDALRAAQPAVPIVVEAAVLIEANWQRLVDEVWVVVADRDAVFNRLRAQRQLDRAGVEARMSKQLDDASRRRHADVVVDNSGTEAELRARLAQLWRERCVPAS
jgi:dephospho-CoA kinase